MWMPGNIASEGPDCMAVLKLFTYAWNLPAYAFKGAAMHSGRSFGRIL